MRRTKEEAEETRSAILDAAERVFFERGVAKTSLETIARAASVTRGAIYWHFQNKADVFSAMVERVRMPLETTLYSVVRNNGTLEDLERHCVRSFLLIHEDARLRRIYTTLLLRCEYSEDLANLAAREKVVHDKVIAALTDFFARLAAEGRIENGASPGENGASPGENGASPGLLARGLYSFMLGLVTDYLRQPENYDMPDDAPALVGLFFAPLAPRPDPKKTR